MRADAPSAPRSRRLDQWLSFARFVKSRSLATRLCTAGAISLNGTTVIKANQQIRVGDTIIVPHGPLRHTIRVLALGVRRGPASEARLLYEEVATPVHRDALTPEWEPLLDDDTNRDNAGN